MTELEFNQYQELSARTAKQHDEELVNFGLGLVSEAGEVADQIKKYRFHGHSINKSEIRKELGDVLWYLSQVARVADITFDEIAVGNIDKLNKRYPDGFSSNDSIKRVDVNE